MSTDVEEEEDYIDIELTSKTRDFEFFTSDDRDTTSPSPADELFFNGKLLPLYFPPRRHFVEHLLCTNKSVSETAIPPHRQIVEHLLCTTTAPCTTANTPSESRNVSPSESCRASCDLNPSDNFLDWPNEFANFIPNSKMKSTKSVNSWPKRLIKHSILTQKLKSSKAYLRSLFGKSVCSDELSSSPSPVSTNKYIRRIADIIRNVPEETGGNRRSFSGAIKRHSPTKCLSSSSSSSTSSSSSFNSSGVRVKFLKRSSSSNEIEGSIDAAIAHCKKSMQVEEISAGVMKFEF